MQVTGFPAWANLLDWEKVLTDTEEKETDWLAWPFIERGTISSVYCDPKDGKSLVMQIISKQIALGEAVLGTPASPPAPVLYLDYENPDTIVGERFLDMGVQAAEIRKNLVYSSFPAMKPLDTHEGAVMLGELVNAMFEYYKQLPALTIIDTLSKTFLGAENSADTFSDLYRHSLLPLRQAKMTVLYLDHSGKDPTAGQRGSSAKPSDVDAVWRLEPVKGHRDLITSVRLVPTHSRASHVEAFTASVRQEPLRVELEQLPVSERALELSRTLGRMGVPLDTSRRNCREILRQNGVMAKNSDLGEALKYRRATGDQGGDQGFGPDQGTTQGPGGPTPSDLRGPSGDQNGAGSGTVVPLYRGDQRPAPAPEYDWQKLYEQSSLAKKRKKK